MKILKISIYLFIILAAFSSCRKDNLVIEEKGKTPDVIVKYEIETSGVVKDRLGNPIEAVMITLGTSTTSTDQNGYFQLTGLANADKGVFKVEKQGYFTGYPVFYPQEGVGQHIKVELMDRVAIGTINNNTQIVSLDQHQVDFSNATFIDASGTTYNGDVTVYAAYLDPTDEDLQNYMPGDMEGINTENEAQLLISYGMLNVELEDEMGNELNIEGEAELTMEIPSAIMSQAPATIPLWYFDGDTGNWMEEGEATLVGNQYVGKVTHFTLWNCDASIDLVTINGFVNTSLNPESFVIRITDSNGSSRTTPLNVELGFTGKVPANENLTLEVLDQCGAVIVTEPIGPFSVDENLGSYDATSSTIHLLTISGSIVDCDLNPVSNGYVMITDDNGHSHFINAEDDGTYNNTIAWCTMGNINVVSFDIDANKVSTLVSYSYSEILSTGSLITCDALVAGIQISGPVINKFIPIPGNIPFSGPQLPPSVYNFTAIDDQGNGNKIVYTPQILDWGSSSTVLPVAVMTSPVVTGTPAEVISWGNLTDPDVPTQIYNPANGGVIDLRYHNVDVEVLDANLQNIATHSGHTIRFTVLFD